MKKILILLLGVAAITQAATVVSPIIDGNKGQSIPLFGPSPNGEPIMGKYVYLDTMEVDTSKYVYRLTDKPVWAIVDTIGYVHFACKDSTGTDTLAIKLKWQGNALADGSGVWANIDSVTLKDLGASGNAAQGVLTNATATPVVNSKAYMSIRFMFTNILGSNANRKSACLAPVLNRHPRFLTSK